MKKRITPLVTVTLILIVTAWTSAFAQDMKTIKLPSPQTDGGMPLMQAMSERKSTRSFGTKDLSQQTLSNLLWAAFGINRQDGRRTAPSAMNWQEVDIYVATKEGCYLYLPKENALKQILSEDIRALTGQQDYVGTAPVNLVYVADLSRMGEGPDSVMEQIAHADTGFIGQNVYLFCASEGLVNVVRGLIDKDALGKKLKLRDKQRIILAQTVGYAQP